MPPTQLKSKPDEKDIELLDYSSAINQLNVNAKKELEETNNKITSANYQLALLRDKIIKDSNEFESWKRAEKLKFTNDMNKIQNEIIANKNRINNEVLQQERITSDLRTQQTKYESLNQDRIALKEELVKLEGKKIEISDMLKQAESRKSEALSMQNQGAMALARASEESEINKQDNIRLVTMNDQIEKRAKQVEEDIKNHTNLKEFVEPKIRSIKEQQDNLDNSIIKNTEEISKLQAIMQEEKILLQSVIDKKNQLDKDINSFKSEKEEFLRQKTLSGN